MFIETESTPNPNTLKFLPGLEVMGPTGETADFVNAEEATSSALATAFFSVNGVKSVFFGRDFVSITKDDEVDWADLKPVVLSVLVDHFVSGQPIMNQQAANVQEEGIAPEDEAIVEQIKELLDTRVRPAVAADGGDIVFRGYSQGVVKLMMQGACSGCPSSRATLKHGVENMLKHYVPEIVAVEQVDL
ncbi:NifU family protein [Entomobacter blattae]|nr:NifU family protein [Entomobacter blattae]